MDIRALMCEMHATESEHEEKAIENKIAALFAELSETEKQAVKKEFLASLDDKLAETAQRLKEVDIAIELAEASEHVNLAAIATQYFGKTKEWLYQRIKGYKVNGKPAQLTESERKTLSAALQDISRKIYNASLRIS
ncbi:MAG: DUF5053 domain-containing protein [Prevotellaceae bacterium]|nr:DUF5053 domain-containing protein [Prevotellaceae bacterium]